MKKLLSAFILILALAAPAWSQPGGAADQPSNGAGAVELEAQPINGGAGEEKVVGLEAAEVAGGWLDALTMLVTSLFSAILYGIRTTVFSLICPAIKFIVVDTIRPLGWQIIVLVALLIFKINIKNLIDRIRGINAGYVSIDTQTPPDPPIVEPVRAPEVPAPSAPEVPAPSASEIPALSASDEQSTSASDEAEESARLAEINNLKYTNEILRLYVVFERIYGLIYGSQLMFMLSIRSVGIDQSIAETFYNQQAQTRFINTSLITFHKWISFLIDCKFIENTQPYYYTLSKRGADFLEYIFERGYSFDKPL